MYWFRATNRRGWDKTANLPWLTATSLRLPLITCVHALTLILNPLRRPPLHSSGNGHYINQFFKEILKRLLTCTFNSAKPWYFLHTDICVTGKQDLKETLSQIFVLSLTSIQNPRVRNCFKTSYVYASILYYVVLDLKKYVFNHVTFFYVVPANSHALCDNVACGVTKCWSQA